MNPASSLWSALAHAILRSATKENRIGIRRWFGVGPLIAGGIGAAIITGANMTRPDMSAARPTKIRTLGRVVEVGAQVVGVAIDAATRATKFSAGAK